MSSRICSIEGCGRPLRARGWCSGHYQRWSKYGTIGAVTDLRKSTVPRGAELSLKSMMDRTIESGTGCFIWEGYVDRGGYGQIRRGGKTEGAHRVAWEIANGPIPEGMSVDHICHDRACVNTGHLRLASPTENQWNRSGAERGSSSGIRNVRWEARRKRWLVRVIKGGRAHGGYYKELEEAALAAETLRRELFGQFSGPTPRLDAESSRSPEGELTMPTLHADPSRIHLPETGLYVRALHTDGTWDAVDIAYLHRNSLDAWLRSRDIDWPIGVVKTLLGHDHKEN